MKKTLLALSVLAAGSAQAGINLYDANGVVVDLSGAAEVQYLQPIQDKDNDNADAGIHLDDGDLQLNTTIAVTDQLNAVLVSVLLSKLCLMTTCVLNLTMSYGLVLAVISVR